MRGKCSGSWDCSILHFARSVDATCKQQDGAFHRCGTNSIPNKQSDNLNTTSSQRVNAIALSKGYNWCMNTLPGTAEGSNAAVSLLQLQVYHVLVFN